MDRKNNGNPQLSGEEQRRLLGWRQLNGGVSGELAIGLQLNGRGYSEEEAAMVAALFGR